MRKVVANRLACFQLAFLKPGGFLSLLGTTGQHWEDGMSETCQAPAAGAEWSSGEGEGYRNWKLLPSFKGKTREKSRSRRGGVLANEKVSSGEKRLKRKMR